MAVEFYRTEMGVHLAVDADYGYTKSRVEEPNGLGGQFKATHVGHYTTTTTNCGSLEEAKAWLIAMHRFEPRRKK